MADVAGLLRCATATACESAENLTGVKRDLVHLLDMARAVVDRSLDQMGSADSTTHRRNELLAMGQLSCLNRRLSRESSVL
ncbi:MAG: hypothetical protein ACRER8_05015 [Pseudomonas sp.]|uniref:hypothetical protein n=1 Tax=Pseudomonas sp. TaxID=306 RepID=UPI003D6E5827